MQAICQPGKRVSRLTEFTTVHAGLSGLLTYKSVCHYVVDELTV